MKSRNILNKLGLVVAFVGAITLSSRAFAIVAGVMEATKTATAITDTVAAANTLIQLAAEGGKVNEVAAALKLAPAVLSIKLSGDRAAFAKELATTLKEGKADIAAVQKLIGTTSNATNRQMTVTATKLETVGSARSAGVSYFLSDQILDDAKAMEDPNARAEAEHIAGQVEKGFRNLETARKLNVAAGPGTLSRIPKDNPYKVKFCASELGAAERVNLGIEFSPFAEINADELSNLPDSEIAGIQLAVVRGKGYGAALGSPEEVTVKLATECDLNGTGAASGVMTCNSTQCMRVQALFGRN